jgi:hypothetical protein
MANLQEEIRRKSLSDLGHAYINNRDKKNPAHAICTCGLLRFNEMSMKVSRIQMVTKMVTNNR